MFSDSSVVPSFLVRSVENESFPCMHNLDERTRQVWRENSRHVRTYEKNWRCCLPIGQNNIKPFLCPIRSQHSLDRLEMVRWESVPRSSSVDWCEGDFWKKKEKMFSLYPKLPEVFFYLVSAPAEEKGSRALSNIIDTFPNDYPYSRCLTMHLLNNTLLSCCNHLRNSLKLKLTELSVQLTWNDAKICLLQALIYRFGGMWEEVRRDKEKRTLGFVCCYNDLDWLICSKGTMGPFLERPGNLLGPKANF